MSYGVLAYDLTELATVNEPPQAATVQHLTTEILQTQVTPLYQTNRLNQDQKLRPNEAIYSNSGQYNLTYQRDSNVCVYQNSYDGYPSSRCLWSVDMPRIIPGHLALQSDGELVAYDFDGFEYWRSYTKGYASPPYYLVMQDDGNVCLFGKKNGTDECIWETKTRQTRWTR